MAEKETLNQTQKKYMYKRGFLLNEINAFAHALTPDGKHMQNFNFMADSFQQMIKTREEYFSKLRAQGWSDMQIRQRINMLYTRKRGKASPWDFLKIEYQPVKKQTDFLWSTKLRAKSRIARTLGAGYSKPMHKETRPRFAPIVRQLPSKPEKPSRRRKAL